MAKNESVEFFLRFLAERFEAFKNALNNFIQTLTLHDSNKKIDAAKVVLETIDDLKRAMSNTDHPQWLGQLETRLNWYLINHPSAKAGLTVIQTLLALNRSIENQKWDLANSASNAAIDFASIYNEYYKASRVPELFDELVSHLEEVISSGEIDSIAAIKALEKLIATIKTNARGDYFSTRGAWEFTQVFFKNYGLELLENAAGIKHVVKAIRKTMSELDLEMSQVHDKVKQRLVETNRADLPMLEYKALALPAPKPDEDADAS